MPSAAPQIVQKLLVRPAVPEEVVLIESTWKQSFWRESLWGKRVTWQVFSRGHQKVIWNLLASSQVLVACDPKRPEEHIGLGYIVFEPTAVHYLWVREHERHKGVARQLFEASGLPADLSGIAVTHGTRAWFGQRGSLDGPKAVPGIGDRFPKSIHDPYRWMEV